MQDNQKKSNRLKSYFFIQSRQNLNRYLTCKLQTKPIQSRFKPTPNNNPPTDHKPKSLQTARSSLLASQNLLIFNSPNLPSLS